MIFYAETPHYRTTVDPNFTFRDFLLRTGSLKVIREELRAFNSAKLGVAFVSHLELTL